MLLDLHFWEIIIEMRCRQGNLVEAIIKKKKKLARHDEYMNEAKGQCINSHLF